MNQKLTVGLILFAFLLIIAFSAPYLPFVDSSLEHNVMRKKDDGGYEIPPFSPSDEYLIGSDPNGIDLLSRVLIGTKETLLTILGIAIIRYIFAIPLGLGSFYSTITRRILIVWNRLFSFIPPVFFIIMIVGAPFIVFSNNRALWFIFVIALVEVGRVADLFHQTMVNISKKPYIETGIISGNSSFKMLKNYYWPPLRPYIIVQFFSDLGRILFLIGQLGIVEIYFSVKFVSQLGGAYKPLNTSNIWPTFFAGITKHIWSSPWFPITGTIAIAITIFTFSMISNGLQQYFHEKYNKYEAN